MRNTAPDPFTGRNHEVTVKRSRKGKTSARVARYGIAPVVGALDRDVNGNPCEATVAAALGALGTPGDGSSATLRPRAIGFSGDAILAVTQALYGDRLPIVVGASGSQRTLLGNDREMFEEMTRGIAGKPGPLGEASGFTLDDAAMLAHTRADITGHPIGQFDPLWNHDADGSGTSRPLSWPGTFSLQRDRRMPIGGQAITCDDCRRARIPCDDPDHDRTATRGVSGGLPALPRVRASEQPMIGTHEIPSRSTDPNHIWIGHRHNHRGPLANAPTRPKEPRPTPTDRDGWVALLRSLELSQRFYGTCSDGSQWSANRAASGEYSGTVTARDGTVRRYRARTATTAGRKIDSLTA